MGGVLLLWRWSPTGYHPHRTPPMRNYKKALATVTLGDAVAYQPASLACAAAVASIGATGVSPPSLAYSDVKNRSAAPRPATEPTSRPTNWRRSSSGTASARNAAA